MIYHEYEPLRERVIGEQAAEGFQCGGYWIVWLRKNGAVKR
jgi:hypothetical protein